MLEERSGSLVTAQDTWSLVYVNALMARDQDGQRLYALQDANFNTTTLVDALGTVLERYDYDAYGNVRVLNPDGSVRGDGAIASSLYGSIYLYQGGRLDPITGLYIFDFREYSPSLGRWTRPDPIGSSDLGLLNAAPIVADAVQQAQREIAAKFVEEHANDRWLWQNADGCSNTYEFVTSDPLIATDPSGLNRYYVGTGHWGVGVDVWEQNKDGRWVVVGQRQYDFSAPHTWYFFAGLVAIPGEVSAKDGVDDRSNTIKSTREQDQKLLEALEYTVKHPPVYTLAFGFTCREYANTMIRIGMDN